MTMDDYVKSTVLVVDDDPVNQRAAKTILSDKYRIASAISGEQAFIYVNDKGFAKRLNVTTGLSDDESVEITEGLTPDAQVIVTWSGSLRDGSKHKIDNASGGTAEAAPVSAQQPAGGAMVAAEPVTGDSDDVMVAVGAGER